MPNLQQRSSHARLFAFLVLFAIIPAWFFYIGRQFEKTVSVLVNPVAQAAEILPQK